ncbi:MAG: hypothetical protein H0X33_13450 [Taibaiella sp.]|nr:hypothetical protein [Taibaiella sp.]
MNDVDKLDKLMDEEEQLIKDRNFYLTMMSCCDDIIKQSDNAGYQKITDQFKGEKEGYHQNWRDANNRLKAIEKEIYALT